MSFSSLGLSASLLDAISKNNYKTPTPIQQAAIPAILSGKDVLGIAKTGSGKTASFVLPLLMNIEKGVDFKNRHVSTLVLVPTRELAVQVEEVFSNFNSRQKTRIKSMAVYGGVSINPQMKKMMGVQILVATPGRLLDLIEKNAVHLSRVTSLVLDEADKMLNLGFKEEMNRIFELLPKKRQNLLFSATLSEDLSAIEQVLLNDPKVINTAPKEVDISLIQQIGYHVTDEKKGPLLRHLIKSENMQQVLVFTSSSHKCDTVMDKLRKNGIDARAIHGKRSQGSRQEALNLFKSGKIRVLVATDLLARGIDIEFLPYVINYELPRSPKDYVHRIGRTGRAENPGKAIALVSPEEKQHFRVIQKKMKRWVDMIDSEQLEF